MSEYELIKMILEGKNPPPQFKKKEDPGKEDDFDPDDDQSSTRKAKQNSPIKDDDNEDGAEEKDSPGPSQRDSSDHDQDEDQDDQDDRDDQDEDQDEPLVDGSSKTKIDFTPKVQDDEMDEVSEKHLGFKKLEGELSHEKGVRDPAGLAAAIGRRKYGKRRFQRMSEDRLNKVLRHIVSLREDYQSETHHTKLYRHHDQQARLAKKRGDEKAYRYHCQRCSHHEGMMDRPSRD